MSDDDRIPSEKSVDLCNVSEQTDPEPATENVKTTPRSDLTDPIEIPTLMTSFVNEEIKIDEDL